METQKWTHAELVDLVREVIGEVSKATDRFGMVNLYREARALELQFMLHNQIVGVFAVPIPPAILERVRDRQANPYDNLQVTVRASMTEPAPDAAEVPRPPQAKEPA